MVISRFLVISLGNPAPHTQTFHSAGHMVLNALQRLIPAEQPPFSAQRYGKKSVLASAGSKYTLLQSPTLMNVSGPWVAAAWKGMLAEHALTAPQLPLVLVHDDLEEDLGVVKIRQWKSSHRGHNGIKSAHASLRLTEYKDSRWARISVGIGRPDARDRMTVSNYVLKNVSKWERSTLEDRAAPAVFDALMELEQKWT